MTFATTDLCDDHAAMLDDGTLAVLPPVYRAFGQRVRFSGPATTLQVFEDNALVRSTLETPGQGHVLVIDGGGSLRRALVGGQLGVLADIHPRAATQVFEKDCLIHLGTVVAPRGRGRSGEKAITGRVRWAGGSADVAVPWGEIRLIPGQGPFQVELHPHQGADIGAGRGRTLHRELPGGVCGLFLDCRGRPLFLAEDDKTRVRQLLKWYEQVGMYPMLVGGRL